MSGLAQKIFTASGQIGVRVFFYCIRCFYKECPSHRIDIIVPILYSLELYDPKRGKNFLSWCALSFTGCSSRLFY